MNNQTLVNKTTVPPGGFRFFCKETGVWIKSASFPELLRDVKKHYQANELPITLMFDRDIETQLCATMPPGVCTYSSDVDRKRASMINRPTWEKFLEATRTMVAMAKGGESLVSQEEAEANAATCAKCYYNQRPDGCSSCNIAQLASALAGMAKRTTSINNKLEGCAICGCALKAKVHFPAHVLAAVAGDKLAVYPDWCWIRKR